MHRHSFANSGARASNLASVTGKDSWKAAKLISGQPRAQFGLDESNVGRVYYAIGIDIFPEV